MKDIDPRAILWPMVTGIVLAVVGFIGSLLVAQSLWHSQELCNQKLIDVQQQMLIDRLYTPPTWPPTKEG